MEKLGRFDLKILDSDRFDDEIIEGMQLSTLISIAFARFFLFFWSPDCPFIA